MNQKVSIRGMTWDHSRGFTPMVATAQRFHELHPGIDFAWSKRSLQEFADKPLADLAEQFHLLVIAQERNQSNRRDGCKKERGIFHKFCLRQVRFLFRLALRGGREFLARKVAARRLKVSAPACLFLEG